MGLEIKPDTAKAIFEILAAEINRKPQVSVHLDIREGNTIYSVPYLTTFRPKGRPLSDRATQKPEKEAQYLSSLTRAHIGMVASMLPRDLGWDSVNWELTRHYPNAINLWEYIQNQKSSPAELLKMLTPAVDAIQFLHEHGFVHRDIKPSNILAVPRTDLFPFELPSFEEYFGYSNHTCMLYDFETVSKANVVKPLPARTRRYAPPEAFGEEHETGIPSLNPQTDTFCLGVSIAELLLAIKEPEHCLLQANLNRPERERTMNLLSGGYMSTDFREALEQTYPNSLITSALDGVINPSPDNRVNLAQFWQDLNYATEVII